MNKEEKQEFARTAINGWRSIGGGTAMPLSEYIVKSLGVPELVSEKIALKLVDDAGDFDYLC